MVNTVFLLSYTSYHDYQIASVLKLPPESFITYCVYKYCLPEEITLKFVYKGYDKYNVALNVGDINDDFVELNELPWQVASCVYPVVMYEDTIITGLCAVARHICKFRSSLQCSEEHKEGLLGFRKSCLQAPNETSIWTKFCEIDIMRTLKDILKTNMINEVPINLVRFESHLSKPVRIHNVYKIARNIKRDTNPLDTSKENMNSESKQGEMEKNQRERVSKPRKWKSNTQKQFQIDSSTKIEDLEINHQFAEGPFLTLADLILVPIYYIFIKSLGETVFESLLPLTYKWYKSITGIPELKDELNFINNLEINQITLENKILPTSDNVSLYKSDPKRSNLKKRLFTKENDIENALSMIMANMELSVSTNKLEFKIKWDDIPDGANPTAGHLPDDRMERKTQQLENLALAVLDMAKEGDLIVDFCSGSGHLGILIAYLLPKCTVILLENKEQSLLRARHRVHNMGLKNVYFFQCNLDFFNGQFNIGVALHACGIASDLVLDKCLNANAKFVLCPCCYGSLHTTDRLVYPRSSVFSTINIDQYLCIGHAADQTHKDHPLTNRGARCMAIIDSDRARLAEKFGYIVTLSRLKPLSCTPKNNLLIGFPS